MELEALVESEILLLGEVSFLLDFFKTVVSGPVSLEALEVDDSDAARIVREKLKSIERAVSELIRHEVHVVGGTITSGSLRFKDGAIVVSGRALAAAVLLYGVVTSYKDLRENVILLYRDVTHILVLVKFSESLGSINFAPANPDKVAVEIGPFLPPREREIVERHVRGTRSR